MRGYSALETRLLLEIERRGRLVCRCSEAETLVRRGLCVWTTPTPPAKFGIEMTDRGELAILCVLALVQRPVLA